ncbi:MAG: hypothetical protein H6626_05095 [Pseudobdellovibrionaceae bacterium]|nr:hypothetical protein [Bdellovibrionales bacterium]USN48468.1 MAG: hypothetical protein H6626_05095 [Pseudobdellovibrionaceae bacterium]
MKFIQQTIIFGTLFLLSCSAYGWGSIKLGDENGTVPKEKPYFDVYVITPIEARCGDLLKADESGMGISYSVYAGEHVDDSSLKGITANHHIDQIKAYVDQLTASPPDPSGVTVDSVNEKLAKILKAGESEKVLKTGKILIFETINEKRTLIVATTAFIATVRDLDHSYGIELEAPETATPLYINGSVSPEYLHERLLTLSQAIRFIDPDRAKDGVKDHYFYYTAKKGDVGTEVVFVFDNSEGH